MGFSKLTINCQKIKQNIKEIKELTGETKLLLIAKANCYGLGVNELCKSIESEIDFIGVATISEAISIRTSGIKKPILLLSEPLEEDFPIISSNDISITIYEKETIKKIASYAETKKVPIKTHFKIDTGMTRLGSPWESAQEQLKEWKESSKYIIKEGIYSHFANSDVESHSLNNKQLSRFQKLTQSENAIKHLANSNAISNIKGCEFDLIRIGFKAYNNAFTLSAPVRYIQNVKKGTSIGYGSTFICDEDCTIGIIGMGYADGLPSELSNKGYVSINNTKCNIIGKICMDMFMIKYPKTISPKTNQTAIIISDGSDNAMTISKAAELANTNPREIMVRFSQRVKREYLD